VQADSVAVTRDSFDSASQILAIEPRVDFPLSGLV
jgi:hypothetical protein